MKDPTEVAVLSCLASHANDSGESCFAGVPRVAALVRRSERTVTRTLDALQKAGWLEIVRGNGSGNLSRYRINAEKLEGCQDVTLRPKQRVTLAQKRVTPATKKGDMGDNPPHPLLGRNVVKQKANEKPPQPPACPPRRVKSPRRGPRSGGGPEAATPGRSANATAAELDAATEQAMLACGLTRFRDRRRLRAQIEALAERGEPPALAAQVIVDEHRKPARERQREVDEENERDGWRIWQGMSEAYKSQNPWHGRVFPENSP